MDKRITIYPYICIRIDVDRFVLLATTGKNAKNNFLFRAVRQTTPLQVDSLHTIYN